MEAISDKRKLSILRRKTKVKLDFIFCSEMFAPGSKKREQFINYYKEINSLINEITKIKMSEL